MNNVVDSVSSIYKRLLMLYPASFRLQYGEEMARVFSQGCASAKEESIWMALGFGFRELRDLPANLLKEHWAEMWRGTMQNEFQPSEPLPKSIRRSVLGFSIGFAVIYLLYCLVDTLLNFGAQIGHGQSIWNGFQVLHPTALAYGIGAGVMGYRYNKRRALISAVLVFLAYTLIWRIWVATYLAYRSPRPSDLESLIVPYIFSSIMGLVIGALIGWIQRGPKKVWRYMLAGVVGFNLGWVVEKSISLFLINISPFSRGLDLLLVGSPWYYLYLIVPVFIYGAVIGLSLAVPDTHRRGQQEVGMIGSS